MNSTAINIIKMFFSVGYSFMTSFYLPGTTVTPLTVTMTGLFLVVTWKMVKKMLGMGVGNDRVS